MDNFSPADMRAVMDGADGMNGFGGGGAWVLIILFALIFGNGGFFGNRNGGNPVTEADLCNANSFSELKGSVGRLSDQIDNVNTNLYNGLCQLGYSVQGQIAQLSQQVATCCCEIKSAIDSVRFDMANYTAQINANTVAVGQRILDKMCEQDMQRARDVQAAQQQRIAQLELQQAMCGVVRYPTQTSYVSNCNPFSWGWGGGCCNNAAI